MNPVPVITIDGPSGSGKGTIAGQVAESLGFTLLDSGALYRTLGIASYKHGIDTANDQQIADLARSLDISFGKRGLGTVMLNGEDVSQDIRTKRGSHLASLVGAIPAARDALLKGNCNSVKLLVWWRTEGIWEQLFFPMLN